jgi:NMD protein affecting ribosome stability and mRNA decay
MGKGKGLIRSHTRKGARSDKKPPVAIKAEPATEPAVCEHCGAVFSRRTWRRGRAVSHALLGRATWTTCPACRQASRGEGFGRVVLRGSYVTANEDAIRRRIENVGARAGFTQPERRVVSVDRDGRGLEVLTTSQKLAHRIVHELKKAFGGRASYAWSDRDGSLFATWEREVASR